MSRITWDQHSHLTRPGLTARLLECFEAATPTDPFHLVVDAFSRSERNFTSDVISEKFKGVCFQNFWPTIAGRAEVLARYGTTDRSAAQSRIKSEIDEIMQRRNRLVHRGRNAYTPSRSEVEQCAEVLAIVVSAIANECPNAIASFK